MLETGGGGAGISRQVLGVSTCQARASGFDLGDTGSQARISNWEVTG